MRDGVGAVRSKLSSLLPRGWLMVFWLRLDAAVQAEWRVSWSLPQFPPRNRLTNLRMSLLSRWWELCECWRDALERRRQGNVNRAVKW